MLEEEGVQFELDGDVGADGTVGGVLRENKVGKWRIRKEFFIDSSTPTTRREREHDGASSKTSGSKKRKMSETAAQNSSCDVMNEASAHDSISEEALRQEILNLLQKRAPGKTC